MPNLMIGPNGDAVPLDDAFSHKSSATTTPSDPSPGGVDLSGLQGVEAQALADMMAITENQIQFNTQMNERKAEHQAANSFQLNG